MTRKKFPRVDFYYQDWAHGTRGMSPAHKGDYITIMCEIWDAPDYAIDFDLERLRVVLGCYHRSEAKKRIEALIAADKLFIGSDGRIHNVRADLDKNGEIEQRSPERSARDHPRDQAQSRLNLGSISAKTPTKSTTGGTSSRARAPSPSPEEDTSKEEVSKRGPSLASLAPPSTTPNGAAEAFALTAPEAKSKSKPKPKAKPKPAPVTPIAKFGSEFAEWWQLFPNKVGKADARKKFIVARKKVDLDVLTDGVRRYIAAKPGDRPWVNPATWLHQERWEDEPAAVPQTARSPPAAYGSPPASDDDYSEENMRAIGARLEAKFNARKK